MSDTVKKSIAFKVKCTKFTHVKAATKKARLAREAADDFKAPCVHKIVWSKRPRESTPSEPSIAPEVKIWDDNNPPPPPDQVMADISPPSSPLADSNLLFADIIPDFVERQNHPVPSLLAMSDEEFAKITANTCFQPEDIESAMVDPTREKSPDPNGGLPNFYPYDFTEI